MIDYVQSPNHFYCKHVNTEFPLPCHIVLFVLTMFMTVVITQRIDHEENHVKGVGLH